MGKSHSIYIDTPITEKNSTKKRLYYIIICDIFGYLYPKSALETRIHVLFVSVLLAVSKGLTHHRHQLMHVHNPKLETQPCDHVSHALVDLIPITALYASNVAIQRMEKLGPTEMKQLA